MRAVRASRTVVRMVAPAKPTTLLQGLSNLASTARRTARRIAGRTVEATPAPTAGRPGIGEGGTSMFPHVVHLETRWRGLERELPSKRTRRVAAVAPGGSPEQPWRLLPEDHPLASDEQAPPDVA